MATAFAREGARLALAARSKEDLEQVRGHVSGTGIEAVALPADISDLGSLRGLVDRVASELGPIDVLVNNAGIEKVWNFETLGFDDIRATVAVNLLGLIWLTRLVVPSMIDRRQGHVVNIASVAGLAAVPHNSVYSATKHGVVGFSRSLRLELEEHGIGVSVVSPGFVDAGMAARWSGKPPRMVGLARSEKVAEAVVSCVKRNRSEVVVAPGGSRIADVVQAVSPRLYAVGMRWSGAFDYVRREANENEAAASE
jgi:short-subunit dehydrogenase